MATKRLDHPLAVHAAATNTRVELFGRARVLRSGAEVRLSPLQLALTVLVFGHGPDGIDRSRAAALLWDCGPEIDVRHRLRQLLVDLRTKAGTTLIEADGDRLRPSSEVVSDLQEFERAVQCGELREAALLLRRDFCDDVAEDVVDGFIEWKEAVGRGLTRRLRGQAGAKWSRSIDASEWNAARDAADALHTLDPNDAEATERVIEAAGRTGDIQGAEQFFGAYLETVDPAIGPAASVEQAMRRVRQRGAIQPIGSREDAAAPFVGRLDALETARWLFGHVDTGHFGFVLISGESGIGKTRLLQELHREALFRDFRCLSAQAVELEARIPLNPLLDALRDVNLQSHLDELGQPWSAVVGAVLPSGTLLEPVGQLPPIQDTSLSRRLLDALSLLMGRLARERRTILFIDDLQWADATTIAALQFIQRRWAGGPLGVVATVRPDLVTAADPVSKYLSGVDGLDIRRVELTEFSEGEALQLVHHLGRGRIAEDRSRWICELACLHPLYITEVTRDYLVGRLAVPQQMDAVTIPVSLEQILRTRFAQVGEIAMNVAGMLATAARPVRITALASLSELTVSQATAAVEELRRARIVECERDLVRVGHELFRSAIYRQLGEIRRAVNHRSWAMHIGSDSSQEAPGELAVHYGRAGDRELAAHFGWLAADRAMETGTIAEAGHFYQLVCDNESDAVRRAEATAGLARALRLNRDMPRANAMLELAANALRAVGKPAEALRLDIKRIEGLSETGAAPIGALVERLSSLKQSAVQHADWEAVALAIDVELHLLHLADDVEGIRALFGEMRALTRKGCAEATLLAHAGLAMGVLFGDPQEALDSARQAVVLASGHKTYRLTALLRLMVVLQYRGMLSQLDSEPVIREARILADRSGDLLLRFTIEGNLALALLDAGDLERAEVAMASASAIMGEAEVGLNRTIQANNEAELALAVEDFAAARAKFLAAESCFSPTTPPFLRHLISAGLGLCALEIGDLAEARRREQELPDAPLSWYFDPTPIVAFRARLLERRRQIGDSIDLLNVAAADLADRIVPAWLKIRAIQVRLMIRKGIPGAFDLASDAEQRATMLRLDYRAREFSDLVMQSQRAN